MPPLLVFGHGQALIITGGWMDGCFSFPGERAMRFPWVDRSQSVARDARHMAHNKPWDTSFY